MCRWALARLVLLRVVKKHHQRLLANALALPSILEPDLHGPWFHVELLPELLARVGIWQRVLFCVRIGGMDGLSGEGLKVAGTGQGDKP